MENHLQFIERKNQEFEKQKEKLRSPTNLKNLIGMKDIGRKGKHFYKREAWTFLVQHNLKEKVFILERLQKMSIQGDIVHAQATPIGSREYRIGYYMIGKNGNKKDRWTWGQYCPMIPAEDLIPLLEKAKNEGVILEGKQAFNQSS